MDGIEKIIAQIDADAQREVQAILTQAQADARTVAGTWEEKIKAETGAILADGQQRLSERQTRLESSMETEGRKLILRTKQDILAQAFDAALKKLQALPQDQMVDLLAKLCVQASTEGNEEVILSPNHRAAIGDKVVTKANSLLSGGKLTLSARPGTFPAASFSAPGGWRSTAPSIPWSGWSGPRWSGRWPTFSFPPDREKGAGSEGY